MKEYIERESLKNALYEQRDKYDPYRSDAEKFVMRGFNEADDVIDSIHAADVEKVRHGRWILVTNERGGSECNQCHAYAPSYQSSAEYNSPYCPNCGAKMDGGVNDAAD